MSVIYDEVLGVVAGVKKIEYREYKPHWKTRLLDEAGNVRGDFTEVHFSNGYRKDARWIRLGFCGIEIIDPATHTQVHCETLNEKLFAVSLAEILESSRAK